MRLTNHLTILKLPNRPSRVSASGWDEDEDDGSSRDPELEEEFLSRDWPEVSNLMKGGSLLWKKEGDWGGGMANGGYFNRTGPRWFGTPRDNPYNIQYEIWAERKFVEQWPESDYYEYHFNGKVNFLAQGKSKSKKVKPRESESVAYGETLAEAQQECDAHYLKEFA